MKKILQAFDNASTKPVAGVNDMKKFVSIVSGIPSLGQVQKSTIDESVISSFEEDSVGGDANQFLLNADKINDEVMANINKIKIHADEMLLKDVMDKFNEFMSAYHAVGKEILQPDMFENSKKEDKTSIFKDYLALAEEKQKGVDGKACWDGYKRVGTKKKGGKTVDNCVPTGKK